jgi:orotate phosphoribosyltransferase-like protein
LGADAEYRDEDVLRELYIERGMTTREVADELDTTNPTVLRWLGKHDIKTREPGR